MATASDSNRQLHRRAVLLVVILCSVLLYGTAGYRWISGGQSSWVDCLYMTTITITTIGFGEIVLGLEAPAARLFTMSLAFLGVGIFTYTVSNITFFATDEELRARWRKRRMENSIRNWHGHYLIGGWCVTAEQIADELRATEHPYLVIAPADVLAAHPPRFNGGVVLEGDPCDEDGLNRAGIERGTPDGL
ncbi:MAG: ion channel [Verrucomicrobiota bacterium]